MDIIFLFLTAIYCFILFCFVIGLFFPNRQQTCNQCRVSVIVAARNEEKNIGNLLSDLVHQTYPSSLYEVIIANDGSEDRTDQVIDEFASRFDFIKQIQVVPDIGHRLTAKKNALNQGIQQSIGELILTTDADCRVKPTWIETMVSYFLDDVGLVVGFSQLGPCEFGYSLFERLQAVDFLALMAAAQGSLNLNLPLAASGQNLAYRREAFKAVGGFEQIKHRVSGDDVLLLQLIKKNTAWKIRFAPSGGGFNWTQPEKQLRSFVNQRKRWASNGAYQIRLNKGFFLFIIITFLVNVLLFIGSPIYYIIYHSLTLPLVCFMAKFLIEFLILLKGGLVYRRKDLVRYFPIWAVCQLPYVVFIGFLGTVGRFIWKDRKHVQQLTTFRTNQ